MAYGLVRFPCPILKLFWQDGLFDQRQPRGSKHKAWMRVRLEAANTHQLCALLTWDVWLVGLKGNTGSGTEERVLCCIPAVLVAHPE